MAKFTVSDPASEPFTKATLKTWLKLDADDTAEDDLLDLVIKATREEAEAATGRYWAPRTVTEYWDEWPQTPFSLTVGPVRSVTSLSYIADGDDDYTVLSTTNYTTDIYNDPAQIGLSETGSFPTLEPVPNAVKAIYTAGAATVDAIPAGIKLAMQLRAGFFYENREDMKTAAAERSAAAVYRRYWRPQF